MIIELLKDNISLIVPLMEGYKASIEEEKLSKDQFAALEKAIKSGDIIFFVAKEENKAVAMCSVTKTFSTFNCNYSGIFEDFYIKPEFRKKGLAKKLTSYVFEYCKENGIDSLWVGSADCDVKMYQALGFDIPLGNLLTWSVS